MFSLFTLMSDGVYVFMYTPSTFEEKKKRYTIRVRLCVMLYPHACMYDECFGCVRGLVVVWLLMCLR